jgi:hypothetical protein
VQPSVPQQAPVAARWFGPWPLALFAVVAVLCLLLACWPAAALLGPRGLPLGIACGLALALVVVAAHVRRQVVVLSFPDAAEFTERLKAQLEGLGYRLTRQGPDRLSFRPRFRSWLFGGGIEAEVQDRRVRVAGPRVYVGRLCRGLRLDREITKVQKGYTDTVRGRPERLLRRVEMTLRVSPAQWPGVASDVLDVLATQDAEMVCDVHLLVQSRTGIRASAVERVVRDRLTPQHIPATIHKELLTVG